MATTPGTPAAPAASATPAQKAARFRKIAEDKNLPQEVRNEYLDKANAVEREAAKAAGMPFAKGGMAKKAAPKKMMYGGMAEKMPAMAKGGAMAKGAKKPAAAIMTRPAMLTIAVGKPKEKMAKGGVAKKK
jgi:hypothetical protein